MRIRSFAGWFLAFCLALGLSAPKLQSQAVYGSIFGSITDQQGAAVVGAKVTVTSVTKGTTDETTTNESGNYTVTHLIPDVYNVKVEAQGFKVSEVKNVQVSADAAARVDTKLEVGAVTQSIEVTGELPQLKTDRADVATTFSEKYVTELPVLNRNFTTFELLSPGTQKLVGWSHAATENPQGGQQIFVNGQHFSGTAFELDGTDNQDPILGIIVVNPNLDAITETKIALQNYDAEFGKAVAGVVTVQTKSGTNELHGSAFWYRRSDAQAARDPFTQSTPDAVTGRLIPSAKWNQFGGTVGGPIIKNKLFAFGDYQGTRQTNGISNQMTIPTATVLSSCDPAKNTNPNGTCDLSQYLGIGGNGQIYQPGTFVASTDPTSPCFDTAQNRANALLTGNCRQPFVNNQIPISMISPQAANVLARLPQPSNGQLSSNFVGAGSGPYKQNSFDTRIDYIATQTISVFGRFSLSYFSLSGKGALGFLGGPGFGPGGLNGTSTVHNYSLASGLTKTFSPTLIADFRFGWFKYNPVTAYSDAGTTPMTTLGIPGLNLGTPDTSGLSSFFFDGNGSLTNFGDGLNVGRCNCPLTESEQQFQWVGNITKTKSNHTFKFGADIRYAMNLRVPSDANRTGQLHFNSGNTSLAGTGGLALASFLLGDVSEFQRFVSTSLTAAERQKRWFFYGQDTWRMTQKLTFNYGLRWEIYFPESVNGKGNGGFANLDQGIIRVGGFGNFDLHGNIDNTYKAFAPRIGIAYQYDPKTVIRLGYGRSFDIGVFGSNFGHVVTQNLPVLANQNIFANTNTPGASNGIVPAFTLAAGPSAFSPPAIPSDGIFPLKGPQNNVDPRIRPTVQRLPTIDAWNVSLQRQVTSKLNVEVAYIGNKGTHVFAGNGPAYNANEAAIGPGTNPLSCTGSGSTWTCAPSGFVPAQPKDNRRRFFLNGVATFDRVFPTFGEIKCCNTDLGNYFGTDASNRYNALQVKVEQRVSDGLQFLAHYTYSHAYNYDSGYFSVNQRYAFGPDDYNRNHVFVANVVYELPFGKGKKYMSDASRALDYVIGGWQITNTSNWSGGLPFTPSIGECGLISDAGPCRPDVGAGAFELGARRAANGALYWFTPVAKLTYPAASTTNISGTDSCSLARPTSGPFSLPACGQIGNAGRNSMRGPRAFFDDMAISKSFSLTERVKAQFRVDAYNVFNHKVLGFSNGQNFNSCVDCFTDASAGRINDIEADASPGSTTGMRQLQFGLRFTF